MGAEVLSAVEEGIRDAMPYRSEILDAIYEGVKHAMAEATAEVRAGSVEVKPFGAEFVVRTTNSFPGEIGFRKTAEEAYELAVEMNKRDKDRKETG